MRDVYEKLERIFGPEFAKRYKQRMQEISVFPPEWVEKAFNDTIESLKTSPDFRAKWVDPRGREWDVFILQIPQKPFEVQETQSGSYRYPLIWLGSDSPSPFVSAFFPTREMAEAIADPVNAGCVVFVVGTLRERETEEGKLYSINVRGAKVL
ncbi:MAG TPA: hypothetical protein ENK81_02990 [Euryarchaeota archaeon]|nr:hypothetical protein [Euryarchaeota archaeon]